MPEFGDVARVWRVPPIPGGTRYESDHEREKRRHGQGKRIAVPEALEASASRDGTTRAPTESPHQPFITPNPEGKGRIIDTWA